jgi:hypothetical protein
VEIHRKPGYDPAELLFDPRIPVPRALGGWKLLKRLLGFRSVFDVIGLDAAVVRGTHGRRVTGARGPVLVASRAAAGALDAGAPFPVSRFPALILSLLRAPG